MIRTLCRPARPLGTLHRRSTFYEAGVFNPAGQCVAVVAYDAKRTKRALLLAVYNHGPEIAAIAGVDASDCDVHWKGEAWRIGDSGFTVRFTGATEYERASQALQAVAA